MHLTVNQGGVGSSPTTNANRFCSSDGRAYD